MRNLQVFNSDYSNFKTRQVPAAYSKREAQMILSATHDSKFINEVAASGYDSDLVETLYGNVEGMVISKKMYQYNQKFGRLHAIFTDNNRYKVLMSIPRGGLIDHHSCVNKDWSSFAENSTPVYLLLEENHFTSFLIHYFGCSIRLDDVIFDQVKYLKLVADIERLSVNSKLLFQAEFLPTFDNLRINASHGILPLNYLDESTLCTQLELGYITNLYQRVANRG